MEVVQFVPQLGKALWNLKGMYDQHVDNKNEIKELQSFIQDYDQQIPILRERFQEGGGNVMGIATFKNLEKDVREATKKLERWSRNKSFFRVFNSAERMQKLGKLHSKVMASVQKSLGIANLSMLLNLQVTQATILESNAELKSLLITSIGSMHGTLPSKVRDEVVEASTSSYGDPKFWEDVLAAVDNHNAGVSSLKEKSMYEDPITTNLMIDPIVASDGNTYCRWTIIDNNLTTNPFNVDEDLTIVIDNLTFRRSLFENFPEQAQIFRQRRNKYRSHAFSLKAQGLWSDAVLALHYVLQWDKRDVECVEALEQVQGALREAKEKYLQPSVGLSNESGNGGPISSFRHEMVVGTSIDLVLFPSLSRSIPEVQQRAGHEPNVMFEHIDMSTFKASQEDGDIICYQKAQTREEEDFFQFGELSPVMDFHNYQFVHFRRLEKPKDAVFSLKLSKQHTYDDVVDKVAQQIQLEDSSKIRLTSHNCYSQRPNPQPIKYRGVERLSDMLFHYNQMSDILYFETLDLPLPVLQGLKTLKVAFHNAKTEEVSVHNFRLPKQSTVGDVVDELKRKVDLSNPQAELRILEVFYHKIFKIFPLNEKIENMKDQYWTLRAEEVPEEEKELGPQDRLIHVYHFTRDDMVRNFGEPFFLMVRENETLTEVKLRIQKKLMIFDEEFSKWKFAFLSGGQPEYLQDDDVVAARFQKRGLRKGAWEHNLGLEHKDSAPRRWLTTYQNRQKPVIQKIYN